MGVLPHSKYRQARQACPASSRVFFSSWLHSRLCVRLRKMSITCKTFFFSFLQVSKLKQFNTTKLREEKKIKHSLPVMRLKAWFLAYMCLYLYLKKKSFSHVTASMLPAWLCKNFDDFSTSTTRNFRIVEVIMHLERMSCHWGFLRWFLNYLSHHITTRLTTSMF